MPVMPEEPTGHIRIGSWNFETFGYDQQSGCFTRLDLLPKVIAQADLADIDILVMQEVWQGQFDGSRLIFQIEELLLPFANEHGHLRACHSPPRQRDSVLGELILLRWPRIRPVRHYVHGAPDLFHDQAGFQHARIDGLDQPLKIKSLHWAYWNGDQRLDAALKLTGHAAGLTLLAGDCNSLWPGESEFEPDWQARPDHKRRNKTLPPGIRPPGQNWVSDRRALHVLPEATFVNVAILAGDYTATVNADIDDGQGGRIDHILASRELAAALLLDTYRVHISDIGNQASDHRTISIVADLDRLHEHRAIPTSQQ